MNNNNAKSTPSASEQNKLILKLIREKRRLLSTAMQAADCIIGSGIVIELAGKLEKSGSSLKQQITLIKEKQKLLIVAMQVSGGSIGLEAVKQLMQLENSFNFSDINPSSTVKEIYKQVEEVAGVKVTSGMVHLIDGSPDQKVQSAINQYIKVYGKGGGRNPEGLFYKILVNEIKLAS